MKVFISGSHNISKLDKNVTKVLNKLIKNKHEIFVGDCNGVDSSIQFYMQNKGYNNLTVYYVGENPRNAIDSFYHQHVETESNLTTYQFYQQKDIRMTEDADAGFVIWDEETKGSLDNIRRLKELKKPVLVYSTKQNKLLKVV